MIPEAWSPFLKKKKQDAMIRLAEKPNVVEIVKRAQLPSEPVNPRGIVKTCLTGLIAGALLGLILALLSEIFSGQVRLIDEIEKKPRAQGSWSYSSDIQEKSN